MDLSLVMFKSDGTRRDFPVTKERVVIGRKPNCDLRIPLSSVSRQHCEIRLQGEEATARDLGSSNGTFHNSVRIQEQTLSAGDELVVGPVVFTIVIDGQPEEIEPVHSYVGEGGDAGSSGATQQEQPAHEGGGEAEPQQLAASGDSMPGQVEEEQYSPTVDLDDPIAALERMADSEQEDNDSATGQDQDASEQAGQQQSDDDEIDLDGLELLDDEDDDQSASNQSGSDQQQNKGGQS